MAWDQLAHISVTPGHGVFKVSVVARDQRDYGRIAAEVTTCRLARHLGAEGLTRGHRAELPWMGRLNFLLYCRSVSMPEATTLVARA